MLTGFSFNDNNWALHDLHIENDSAFLVAEEIG